MPFVIVDDRSNDVLFSNEFYRLNVGGQPLEFLATTTEVQGSVDVTYSFTGTSVQVFGSIVDNDESAIVDPTALTLIIDQSSKITDTKTISTNDPTVQHYSPFDTSILQDGQHQLDLNFSINGTDSNFYLDYIIYDATVNSTLPDKSFMFIDDTSTYLQYSLTGWSPSHSQTLAGPTTSSTFNQSIAQTTTSGATVSLIFWGFYLEIRGLVQIAEEQPVAFYTLDGTTPVNVSMPGSDVAGGLPAYNWMFGSNTMSEGLHNLTITSFGPGFYLDYIAINASKAYIPSTTLFGTISSGSTTSASSASPVSTSSIPSIPSTSTHGTDVGAIAGGVVGGLVFLAVLVAALCFWRKRRNTQNKFPVTPNYLGVAMEEDVSTRPLSSAIISPYALQGSGSSAVDGLAHNASAGIRPNRVSSSGGMEGVAVPQRRKGIALSDSSAPTPPPYSHA